LAILQAMDFVIAMSIWIFLAGIFQFFPEFLFRYKPNFKSSYSKLSFRSSGRKKRVQKILIIRIISSIISILITIYLVFPYVLDFPRLVTGKFDYIVGYVEKISTTSKGSYEYVLIKGKELRFFFSSNVEKGKKYKIAYLPHTNKAIHGVEIIDSNEYIEKKIDFPSTNMVFSIGISLVIVILLALFFVVGQYMKFKLLILASIAYYPLSTYLYISEGISYKNWFSFSNQGLLLMSIGMISSLILLLYYFFESRQKEEYPVNLFYVQALSIIKIIIVILILV